MRASMPKRTLSRRTMGFNINCLMIRRRRHYGLSLIICTLLVGALALTSQFWCDDSYLATADTPSLYTEDPNYDVLALSNASLRNEQLCDTLLSGDSDVARREQHGKFETRASAQRRDDDELVTIVTGYFRMRPFCKTRFEVFDTDLYVQWMAAYARLLNPVIFYTDDAALARRFLALRANTRLQRERTQVCVLRRSSLWVFDLLPEIGRVLGRSDYPRHIPNTVFPEYGTVQHSKYALMRLAINSNPFDTTYLAWFDVGLLRLIVENDPLTFASLSEAAEKRVAQWDSGPTRADADVDVDADSTPVMHETQREKMQESKLESEHDLVLLGYFSAALPPNFDRSRVAYNKALRGSAKLDLDVSEYFERNMVLLGGGTFLGSRSVLQGWLTEYEKAARHLLALGWSSTDQQVLYAMHSETMRPLRNESLRVQAYSPPIYIDPVRWFFLPLLMIHTHRERVLFNRSAVYVDHEAHALAQSDLFSSSALPATPTHSRPSKKSYELVQGQEFDPRKYPLPLKYWPRYYHTLLLEWFCPATR